jgi:putative oxidoreductase
VVFLSEGIQKFLFPAERGAGRFADIGLPYPEFMGYFVGFFEAMGGALVLLGLVTRLGALPIMVIMLMAIYLTKTDVFANDGFWKGMHASRLDWSMLLGSLFLLIKGGGKWSIDRAILMKKYKSRGQPRYWN